VTTSEFDDIKARLARIENKRRLTDSKDTKKPSLRRASTTDPNNPNSNTQDSDDGPPTLHRREDQNFATSPSAASTVLSTSFQP
jgi:hypothetical protein